MCRQAYRRRHGVWSAVSAAIESRPGQSLGFNSVGGLDEGRVVAVGLAGEVWWFDGNVWRVLDSSTSVALHRVLVLPSGHALMCGAAGVVLQADANGIATVQNDVTQDNLYGLAWLKGRALVSSATDVHEIGNGGLQRVDTGLLAPVTCGSLDANETSSGARARGISWSRMTVTAGRSGLQRVIPSCLISSAHRDLHPHVGRATE